MKKLKAILVYKKHIAYTSIVCIIAGFIMSTIGLSMVDYDMYKLNPDQEYEMVSKEKSIPLQDVDSIEIDLHNANVTVESTEEDEFQLQYEESENRQIQIETDGKTLMMKHITKIQFFKFNWMNFGYEKDVTINLQVPKDYIGSLTIKNGYGNVNVSNLIGVDEIIIENERDEINAKNIEAKKISIKNAYGKITSDNLISQNELHIENERDEMDVKNLNASKITLYNAYGNIKANHIVSEHELRVNNERKDVELTDIKASDFYGDMAYSSVQIDTMDLKNEFRLENERNDVTLQNIQSLKSRVKVTYGDVVMRNWISNDIEVNMEHGNITSDILGVEKEYHITSQIENGESNLAKERNIEGTKKFSITLSYGDADVNFSE